MIEMKKIIYIRREQNEKVKYISVQLGLNLYGRYQAREVSPASPCKSFIRIGGSNLVL
jgi:hypothetical protein